MIQSWPPPRWLGWVPPPAAGGGRIQDSLAGERFDVLTTTCRGVKMTFKLFTISVLSLAVSLKTEQKC